MSGAPPSEPPSNQLLSSYKSWQERTAFTTRTITVSVVILSVLALFGLDLTTQLGNIPAFSVFHFEVYRLILSPFVNNSVITSIIMLLFFPAMGTQIEQQMGSAAFAGLFLSLTLCTNLAFAAICTFLSFFGMPEALLLDCSGFWVQLFSIITLDCMKNPELPRRLMCFPFDIPSMYFPLALFGFFCLFGGFQLSFAVGILVGYAWHRGHLDMFKLSDSYVESLEDTGGMLYSTSRNSTGWIFTVRGASATPSNGGAGYSAVSTSEHGGTMQRSGPSSIGGFGGSTAPTANAIKPGESFPGRGNTAGGPASAPAPTRAEDMKARRLAALAPQDASERV